MKNESQLVSQINNYLKTNWAYCEKIFGGGFQSAGIPDIIACYRGYFVAIEVKSPTGKGRASDIQKLKIRAIREAGGVAFITDNIEDVERVLNFIDNGNLELLSYNDRYL